MTPQHGHSETFPEDVTITRIDAAVLSGVRPHVAGCNARLGVHGTEVREPIVRIHTNTGIVGWGWSRAKEEDARRLISRKSSDVFDPQTGTRQDWLTFDFPLWDLAGHVLHQPVHALLGDAGSDRAPMYDGSIYMNDVDPNRIAHRGLQPVLETVDIGLQEGFHAFKVKVGRGFQWMEKGAGFKRDVEVIRAVRERIGPDKKLLIDANNGYTTDEAREVMRQCGDCDIYWFEEPFPEDKDECLRFKQFMRDSGRQTLLADGEGAIKTESEFTAIVRAGGIDVVQFDLRGYTLTKWRQYVSVLDETGARSAPHNWGSHLSGFYLAQFARGCPHFAMGEADTMTMALVIAEGYKMVDGLLQAPDAPGFGLELHPAAFKSPAWSVE